MSELRGITELRDYGKINIKIKLLMDKYNVSIYKISKCEVKGQWFAASKKYPL